MCFKVTITADEPPPIIQIGPLNQTVPLQSKVSMLCQASGTPTPRIRWYRNGSPILGQGPRVKIFANGTLHIESKYLLLYIGKN